VFVALSTQWRMAPMGGVVGLDYSAIAPVLELSGIPREQWTDVFADLRVMEQAALQSMRDRSGR
jgi:hypothetical protein